LGLVPCDGTPSEPYGTNTVNLKKNEKMNSKKVVIEIWSDVVCPFCYVGKKKLEQAVQRLNAEDKVEIVWHSFQLDPDFPKGESIPSTPYLSQRKGYPIEQVKAMSEHLTVQGKSYNIDFNFNEALTFNTLDAHRLIQWAKTVEKSDALKEALMKAYFTDGMDLSKKVNLIAVCKSLGLDSDKAKAIIESNAFEEEVQQDIYQSRQLAIRGVPYFLINESLSISGAQSDEIFESVISSALKDVKAESNDSNEGVCLPDGDCK
jgi:predicted DsbA family dithiol-disulfide isomerase